MLSAVAIVLSLELEAGTTVAIIVAVNVIVTVVILFIQVSPLLYAKRAPAIPDGGVDGLPRPDLEIPYEETIPLTILLMFYIPMLVIYSFSMIRVGLTEPGSLWIYSSIFSFLLLIVVLFGVLHVRCDPEEMAFGFGPFRKRLKLGEVVSIRPVAIDPLKEYMGWGPKIGSDGSKGYIASGKVGVRIETQKRDYVITVPEPQALVAYVRTARDAGKA